MVGAKNAYNLIQFTDLIDQNNDSGKWNYHIFD
jgi:hypothetical protein